MKFSVIVPVYNVENYLEECIESILMQTFKDFEIILVDDGSTDGSGKICDNYQNIDDRIRVIHKENGGLSDARNAGIDKANGEYLCFVDSDDMVKDTYLETFIKLANETNADIVCCDLNRGTIPNWAQPKEELIIRENDDILDKMYIDDGKITLVWNKMYRKELFKEIRFKKGIRYEDMQIMPRLLHEAKKMAISNDNIYFYRQREGSITKEGTFNKKRLDLINVVEDRMMFLESLGKTDLLNREIEGYIRKLIRYRAKMDKYNYDDETEIALIENKLVKTLKSNMFNGSISIKTKFKAILEIMKRHNLHKLFAL